MFGLGIHYLNGWAMAAVDGAKKHRAEWPPHPDRIFMAMAAAYFENGQSEDVKTALEWMEALPPPGVRASDFEIRHEQGREFPNTSYVPVNDSVLAKKIPEIPDLKKMKDAGLGLLPEHRSRQPRKFPVAVPHEPVVYLVWEEDIPDWIRTPLVDLCRKVVNIGHSASLVQMWLADDPPPPNLVPSNGVTPHRLRVFGPGKLDYLKNRCNRSAVIRYQDATAAIQTLLEKKKEVDQKRKTAVKSLKGVDKKEVEAPFRQELKRIEESMDAHQETLDQFDGRAPNSLRPEPGLWQGYGRPMDPPPPKIPGGLFDENLVVMTLTGKRLGLSSTLKLLQAIRGALLAACPEPVPEWVSGHRPDRSPSLAPHLALLPLPFVQHAHADGRIMGAALALPRELDPAAAGARLNPWLRDEHGLPRSIKLFDGRWLECTMELETRESPPWNLRRQTWTRPSRTWASVTPVVLDRHFSGRNKWEKAAEIVKDACGRIGLPRPENVLLQPVSLVEGTPHAREFPPLRRKSDNGRMYHTHAVIVFSEPVMGPVLLGAGRFRGYGLCRPMDRKGEDHE